MLKKTTQLRKINKEDIIICPECRSAFIDTGPPDALIIIKTRCPECNSNKLKWAIT